MSSTRVTSRAGVFFCAIGALLVFAGLLAGCRSGAPNEKLSRFGFNEPHMGTLFSITLTTPPMQMQPPPRRKRRSGAWRSSTG